MSNDTVLIPLENLKPGQVLFLVTDLGPYGRGQYTFTVASVNADASAPCIGVFQAFSPQELFLTFKDENDRYGLVMGTLMYWVDEEKKPILMTVVVDFQIVAPQQT